MYLAGTKNWFRGGELLKSRHALHQEEEEGFGLMWLLGSSSAGMNDRCYRIFVLH